MGHTLDSILPNPLRRNIGKVAAEKQPRLPGEPPVSLAPKDIDPRNITGRRGGRAKGVKNKKVKHIRDLLACGDPLGVNVIKRILTMRIPKHADTETLMGIGELQLKALALAWAYRHGKPRPQGDNGEPLVESEGQTTNNVTNTLVIRVGGNEEDYTNAMRRLRNVPAPALPRQLTGASPRSMSSAAIRFW